MSMLDLNILDYETRRDEFVDSMGYTVSTHIHIHSDKPVIVPRRSAEDIPVPTALIRGVIIEKKSSRVCAALMFAVGRSSTPYRSVVTKDVRSRNHLQIICFDRTSNTKPSNQPQERSVGVRDRE